MTEEALKAARDRLVAALDFDTEAASHAIDAVTETLKRIRKKGGGEGTITFELSGTAGHKLVLREPEISVSEPFHRRRTG
jgi:hypothetical protein